MATSVCDNRERKRRRRRRQRPRKPLRWISRYSPSLPPSPPFLPPSVSYPAAAAGPLGESDCPSNMRYRYYLRAARCVCEARRRRWPYLPCHGRFSRRSFGCMAERIWRGHRGNQMQKYLLLILSKFFFLPVYLGTKNWLSSMKVNKLVKFEKRTCCQWSSLNAPSTETPLSDHFLKLSEFPFLNISLLG